MWELQLQRPWICQIFYNTKQPLQTIGPGHCQVYPGRQSMLLGQMSWEQLRPQQRSHHCLWSLSLLTILLPTKSWSTPSSWGLLPSSQQPPEKGVWNKKRPPRSNPTQISKSLLSTMEIIFVAVLFGDQTWNHLADTPRSILRGHTQWFVGTTPSLVRGVKSCSAGGTM